MDKKNDQFENDDLLDEEAFLEDDDAECEALLKLVVKQCAEAEAKQIMEMPVPDDCKPSPRLKRRLKRVLKKAVREDQRKAAREARQTAQSERRAFVSFRTLRHAVYITILLLLCLSVLVISVGAVKTCGFEALWSTGIKAKSGILQVPIPVEKARVSPPVIEQFFAPEVEPLE